MVGKEQGQGEGSIRLGEGQAKFYQNKKSDGKGFRYAEVVAVLTGLQPIEGWVSSPCLEGLRLSIFPFCSPLPPPHSV